MAGADVRASSAQRISWRAEASDSSTRARSKAARASGPPRRPRAQAAWPRTSGSGAAASARASAGIAAGVPGLAGGGQALPRGAPPLGRLEGLGAQLAREASPCPPAEESARGGCARPGAGGETGEGGGEGGEEGRGAPGMGEGVGVLAVPAQAGTLRHRAIYHAAGVAEDDGLLTAGRSQRTQIGGESVQPAADDLVVVVAP